MVVCRNQAEAGKERACDASEEVHVMVAETFMLVRIQDEACLAH